MSAVNCGIGTGALLLLLLPQAIATPPQLARPGEEGYWLHLLALYPDHGLLAEDGKQVGTSFNPLGSKYTLRVPSPDVTAVSLLLQFDFSIYPQGQWPNLYFDGQQQKVDPLGENKKTISLSASWRTFDETLWITLEDPYRPTWYKEFWRWFSTIFRGHRKFEYEVRIMQPPDLGDEPLVADVILKDSQGTRLRAEADNSLASEFDFVLPRGEKTATLQVLCSDKANGLAYDQSKVEMGDIFAVDLADASEDNRIATCSYHDEQWPSADTHGVVFVKIRANMDLMGVKFMLSAVSADGYCEKGGASGGFLCRVTTNRLDFVAYFDDDRAEAELVGSDGKRIMFLPNGRVSELLTGGGREEYKVVLRLGSNTREYPMTVIRPAWCVTMQCPAGTALKGDLKHDKDARSVTCKHETCTAEDAANCCEATATCNTFASSCPAGQVLRSDASTTRCLGLTCTMADAVRCCQAKAKCTTLNKCPDKTQLRTDAASVMCNSWQCEEDDSGTCCVGWRSHYVFGYVMGFTPPDTYRIHFDFGLEEDVPAWAVMGFDVYAGRLSSGQLKVGDRVEARVNDTMAATLMSIGVSVYGIAVRERLSHYMAHGCGPVPQICMGKAVARKDNFVVPQSPGPIPVNMVVGQAPYNATLNPEGRKLCYYDVTCRTDPSQNGCKYWGPEFIAQPYLMYQGPEREGWSMSCRACGFDNYPRCPSVPDCTYEEQSVWSPEKKTFCCNAYRIGCPYDCRFGDETVRKKGANVAGIAKVRQEEFEGRFKYWTKEQTSWCCEQHNIGCGPHAAAFLEGPKTDAIQKDVLLPQLGVSAGGAHQRAWPFLLGLIVVGLILAASLTLITASATGALRRAKGYSRAPQPPADDVRSLFLDRKAVMNS